jgi:AbrB family looped-hinge helix DNA binding protein
MRAIFNSKAYSSVTVNKKGAFVIPPKLRKVFKIKHGDRVIIFVKLNKKIIGLIPLKYFIQSKL